MVIFQYHVSELRGSYATPNTRLLGSVKNFSSAQLGDAKVLWECATSSRPKRYDDDVPPSDPGDGNMTPGRLQQIQKIPRLCGG